MAGEAEMVYEQQFLALHDVVFEEGFSQQFSFL